MSSKQCIRPLALAVSGLMMTACSTVDPVTGSPDPSFGEAVKYNAAIQTIDPAPVYADTGAQPGDSGERGAEAVKRYREGQVKEVDSLTTPTGTGSGAGPS